MVVDCCYQRTEYGGRCRSRQVIRQGRWVRLWLLLGRYRHLGYVKRVRVARVETEMGTTRQRKIGISRPHRQRHSPSKLHPLTQTGNPPPHRTPKKSCTTLSPSTPSTRPLILTPNGMRVRFGRLKSIHHPMVPTPPSVPPPPRCRRPECVQVSSPKVGDNGGVEKYVLPPLICAFCFIAITIIVALCPSSATAFCTSYRQKHGDSVNSDYLPRNKFSRPHRASPTAPEVS